MASCSAFQTLVMLAHPEYVDGLLLGVPVAPNALKHTRAVVEGVGHYAYIGLFQRYELSAKEHLKLIGVDSSLAVGSHVMPPGEKIFDHYTAHRTDLPIHRADS